ncbi:hypothetical protein BC833DRAFT_573586 [Globomyces pollinis-pini]|nr:hypothetical protein BC833DRAFT_573586 [Globomyces pollinis-pini]KAJ3000952.1 hypothetical protein HDV02_000021 [Globomyces sp. JEL0801]
MKDQCPFVQRIQLTFLECHSNILNVEHKAYLDACADDYKSSSHNPKERLSKSRKRIEEFILQTNHLILLPSTPIENYKSNIFLQTFEDDVMLPFYTLLRSTTIDDQEKYGQLLLNGIRTISSLISGPFVLGDKFTLVDILTISWALKFDLIELWRGVHIPHTVEYEAFHDWIQHCQQRKSVVQAHKLDRE